MIRCVASLLLLAAVAPGCASIYSLPDRFGYAIDSMCDVQGRRDPWIANLSSSDACSCQSCRPGALCHSPHPKRELLIAVGPPAHRFRPEMPPEFLPVPPRPVFANINAQAPDEYRGAVELSFDPKFTVQGRD